jgi:hypothetical protein
LNPAACLDQFCSKAWCRVGQPGRPDEKRAGGTISAGLSTATVERGSGDPIADDQLIGVPGRGAEALLAR